MKSEKLPTDLLPSSDEPTFTFLTKKDEWLVKLYDDGRVFLNREKFPHSGADEFARAFVEIVNNCCYGTGSMNMEVK